jgi:hypothetical protein
MNKIVQLNYFFSKKYVIIKIGDKIYGRRKKRKENKY